VVPSHSYFFVSSLVLALASTIASCGRRPESCFDLASDSRLPGWFSLPAGVSRSNVTVHMCYYIDHDGRSSTFEMRTGSVKLAEARGTDRGLHPVTANNTKPKAFEYPVYEVITVDRVTEAVEHRRADAKFYVVDDPAIRRSLGVTN